MRKDVFEATVNLYNSCINVAEASAQQHHVRGDLAHAFSCEHLADELRHVVHSFTHAENPELL